MYKLSSYWGTPHDLGNIPWNINRGHLDPTGNFSEKSKQLPEKSGVMALWPTLPPKNNGNVHILQINENIYIYRER